MAEAAAPAAGAKKKKSARTKSARKRARQTPRKTAVNRVRTGRARTAARAVELAITAGDKTKAQAALKLAEAELARAGQQGVIHWRAAARKISRLAGRIRKMG
ncbi:MAG: 30S ribosomal protein S20 [Alphaproteobacteria bacterium]|nr:30S ribosomal protein S20 [Alphaproteobacteria bacterium]